MIDRLKSAFGKGTAIKIDEGVNDLTKVVLKHDNGGSVDAYLLGGHITSWRAPGYGEALFLSTKANFEDGSPIRGGIPVIFPQFGAGTNSSQSAQIGERKLPSHGFARTNLWDIQSTNVSPDGTVSVVLKLESSPELLDLWPRRFRVELGIHLSSSLSLSFKVLNLDQSPIIFQHAFHTYFQIRSIKKVVINGLHEAMYIDQLANNERKKESKRILTFDGETDRIYTNVPRPVTMLDPVYKRKYVVAKRNMADYVIWNPWEKKNLALPDLSEGAYQNMVCIEAGNIVQSITVEPGGTFEAYMNLSVVSLTSPDPGAKDDWPGLPPS